MFEMFHSQSHPERNSKPQKRILVRVFVYCFHRVFYDFETRVFLWMIIWANNFIKNVPIEMYTFFLMKFMIQIFKAPGPGLP